MEVAFGTQRWVYAPSRDGVRRLMKWILVWSQTPIETVLAALLQVEEVQHGCVIRGRLVREF